MKRLQLSPALLGPARFRARVRLYQSRYTHLSWNEAAFCIFEGNIRVSHSTPWFVGMSFGGTGGAPVNSAVARLGQGRSGLLPSQPRPPGPGLLLRRPRAMSFAHGGGGGHMPSLRQSRQAIRFHFWYAYAFLHNHLEDLFSQIPTPLEVAEHGVWDLNEISSMLISTIQPC